MTVYCSIRTKYVHNIVYELLIYLPIYFLSKVPITTDSHDKILFFDLYRIFLIFFKTITIVF